MDDRNLRGKYQAGFSLGRKEIIKLYEQRGGGGGGGVMVILRI